MKPCWIVLATPDLTEDRTIPSGDRRSLAALRSRGWVPVRIIRANLPWPARQLLVACTHGHAELTRLTSGRSEYPANGRPDNPIPQRKIAMLTLHTSPASAPVLRLLIATMRDLREQAAWPAPAGELLGQVKLTCAAAGLDETAVPELVHALRTSEPICTVAREPARSRSPELPWGAPGSDGSEY